MTDSFIQLPPDSTGKKVRGWVNTIGADDVYAQAFVPTSIDGDVLADASGVMVQGAVVVSGTVTATGPLTDAELRAAPVDVDGSGVTQPISGTVTIQDGGNTITVDGTVSAVAAGDVAHDSPDSGNPVKIGGKALSDPPAAVTAGDRVNSQMDMYGRLGAYIGVAGVGYDGIGNASVVEAATLGRDVQSGTGGNPLLVANTVFNGVTWDRSRTAATDGASATGLTAAAGMVFNGSGWDRRRGDTTGVYVQGNIASDQPVTGKPLLGGARASTASPSPVSADGDAVALWALRTGALNVADAGGSLTVDAPVGTPAFVRISDGTSALIAQKAMALSVPVVIASDQTAVPVSGTVTIQDGGNVITVDGTVAVTAAALPLPSGAATSALQTQPGVDIGDVTVNNANGAAAVNVQDGGNSITVDGPVTDAQLRAAPVDVDGSGVTQPVSGTFWQATQPVSAAALPLPSGAATSALQTQPGVDIGDVTVNNANGAAAVNVQDGGNTLTVDAPVATPVFTRLSDGAAALIGQDTMAASLPVVIASDQTAVKNTPPQTTPLTLGIYGSIGITTAATWDEQLVYAVPASTAYKVFGAQCAVTTAATRTLIVAGKRLGTFNPNTNVYAADGSTSGNDFYDRLFYRVTVTHSATATTITATYTDQAGASSTSVATVIPSAAPAGNLYEVPFATGDFGVQSVTNITDTAAPNSVTDEIWGFRTIMEDIGPAQVARQQALEDIAIPNGETVFILFNAAATTAQQRFANLIGALVAA